MNWCQEMDSNIASVFDYGSEGGFQLHLMFTSWYQGGWFFFDGEFVLTEPWFSILCSDQSLFVLVLQVGSMIRK